MALAAALTLGCASDPALRAEIDRAFSVESDARIQDPGAHDRVPWAVGQWVQVRISRESQEGIFRLFGSRRSPQGTQWLGITGREGDAFWLESRTVEPGKERRAAALVAFPEGRVNRIELRKMRVVRDGGKVDVIPPDDPRAQDAREILGQILARLEHIVRTGRRREVRVPAGTFVDARAVPLAISTSFGRETGFVWYTNAVPVLYYAKATRSHRSWVWFEETLTYELVDYGLTGAESRLAGGAR